MDGGESACEQLDGLLQEQARYYRERAPEYDDWWLRRGRYDHGSDANGRWFADAAELEAALERFGLEGQILELACGTGLWTCKLLDRASELTAVDGSTEMLELNEARLAALGARAARVRYVHADLFAWEPSGTYDGCFFGFWLSHVPEARFGRFWETVWRALRPGGKVFFVDSARHELASAADHELPQPQEQAMVRRLNDGREFQIVKRFYDPETLERRLQAMGWNAHVGATAEFFIYGQAIKDPDEAAPRS